jgi:hypothetical protein
MSVSSILKGAIDVMIIEHSRRRGTDRSLTFTEVANHFSTLVRELPTTKMAQRIGSVGSGKRGAHKVRTPMQKGRKIRVRKVVAMSMLRVLDIWALARTGKALQVNNNNFYAKNGTSMDSLVETKERIRMLLVSGLSRTNYQICPDCHWRMSLLLSQIVLLHPSLRRRLPLK